MLQAITFTQTIPATTWHITHNFGRHPVSDVWVTYGGGMQKILPYQVIHVNDNELSIIFESNQSGQARLF
jgi:hypothetical protein